jgi:hypothetical protein
VITPSVVWGMCSLKGLRGIPFEEERMLQCDGLGIVQCREKLSCAKKFHGSRKVKYRECRTTSLDFNFGIPRFN